MQRNTARARNPRADGPRPLHPTWIHVDAASEPALRAFIERSPAMIAMFDRQMRYKVASRRWLEVHLPGRTEVAGLSHYALFPELPQRWKDVHKAGLAGQTLRAERDPFPRPDGRVQYVNWEVRPWTDAQGAIGGILIFAQDVTQEVEAAEARDATEATSAALLDCAPSALVLVGEDGRIESANRSAEALFGHPRSALIGAPIEWLVPSAVRSDHTGHVARFIAAAPGAGRGHGRDVWAVRADGSEVPVDVALSTLVTPRGRKVIASIIDLSARKALEAELRQKSRDAEAASIAKSEFLANMSHEIRTPLTGVIGFAALLGRLGELSPKAKTYVERIARSADALTGVVTNILDYSQLDAGLVTLSADAVDVRDLVRGVVDQLRPLAEEKGLRIEPDIAEAVPAGIEGDAGRLRQVLLNLATNALKFSDRGRIVVRVRFLTDKSRLRVEVADTGPGVAPDAAERLFEPFTQADTSNARSAGGTGLGLAICKAVVTLMHGRIGVSGEPGAGSVFWFEAPARPVSPAGPPATRAAPSERSGDGLRILLVDDAPINRELVSAMLTPCGMDVTEVGGGADAVDAALDRRFDIILMDLQMPGVDGLAATRAIRANSELNRDTPIIAVSANVLRDQIDAALSAGMNDYVEKPIQPRDLLTKIVGWSIRKADPS